MNKNAIIHGADILLPKEGIDLSKWAVVAVDQHTSEPDYWESAEQTVGTAPSTLRLVLPEIYLSQSEERIPRMQQSMHAYLEQSVLETKVHDGYMLVERETSTGLRLGLMACVDLEAYDFTPGFDGAIRATEGTVLERVPPRVRLRRGAPIELPHILMLINDEKKRIIEPLYSRRDELPLLYDFELMLSGGRIRAWKIEGEVARALEDAFEAHYQDSKELFLAVGDGNHSLAAARAFWLELRGTLPENERDTHPARFALAEIENLASPAIVFEPIHRLLTGVNPKALLEEARAALQQAGLKSGDHASLRFVSRGMSEEMHFDAHPLGELQGFLDAWLAQHPQAQIDYIHGDDTLSRLADRDDALGICPSAFAKSALFPYILAHGVLPRKTFSMGEADEKRFYCEARRIDQ